MEKKNHESRNPNKKKKTTVSLCHIVFILAFCFVWLHFVFYFWFFFFEWNWIETVRAIEKTRGQIKSNQIKSNQIKSNQIKSNQIKSNQEGLFDQWWTMVKGGGWEGWLVYVWCVMRIVVVIVIVIVISINSQTKSIRFAMCVWCDWCSYWRDCEWSFGRPFDSKSIQFSLTSMQATALKMQIDSVDLFRSEDMQFVRLLFTMDASHEIMRGLGSFGKFHLVDVRINCESWFAMITIFVMVGDQLINLLFVRSVVSWTSYAFWYIHCTQKTVRRWDAICAWLIVDLSLSLARSLSLVFLSPHHLHHPHYSHHPTLYCSIQSIVSSNSTVACANWDRKLTKFETEMQNYEVKIPNKFMPTQEVKGDVLSGVQVRNITYYTCILDYNFCSFIVFASSSILFCISRLFWNPSKLNWINI